MINTLPLSYLHRDMLNRVIRANDIVVWANGRQGSMMRVCEVVGSTEETVRIRKPNGRLTNVTPQRLIVITAQVERNIAGNVGANQDLEATRPRP